MEALPKKLPHQILADELDRVQLHAMATKAREGYYHDFLSPLALPDLQLLDDLMNAALGCPDKKRRAEIAMLAERHKAGEFDATKEESDKWAKSDEGREAFGALLKGE